MSSTVRISKWFEHIDAILEFTNKCINNLNNKLYSIAVFLDLSRAFDTCNKEIMIRKLERLGFRGVVTNWFRSYLTDRKIVNVGNIRSESRTVNIGLPQGSVSSPYLFQIYVNDVSRSSEKLNFIHFSDDTTMYMTGSNLSDLCEDVSIELAKVSGWLQCNRLSHNVSKTSFMLFTHANTHDIPVSVSIGSNLSSCRR